ncbi:FAD-dependent oxidoreductase [Saccharopolyspora cebuensis]|uniref:FAD-dependent oxidoreductase n=1 Tax=Saccharopolyspora cebuensis TaxID=418759 RepID=A0ABV4CCX8_9PSEU
MATERYFDVVVVGGGAAGLGGALTLARARRSVLVVDAGEPRNAPAAGVHGYLGHDGLPPAELLARGRAEVRGAGGEIVRGEVVGLRRRDTGDFEVSLADGSSVSAARLLVATGLVDELPEVPGLARRWGADVLHCPYCHGWEVRDEPIGVLATGPMAVHQALLWRQWSEDVTLLEHTAPGPDDAERERLAARGVAVVPGEVTGVEVSGDRLSGVRLADGRVVPCRALVVAPRFTARAEVLAGLGLEPVAQERGGVVLGSGVEPGAAGATGVPGVRVAGNVSDIVGQVVGSVAAGVQAAAALNAELVEADTERAVAAQRAAVRAYWEDRYGGGDRIWTGDPNATLVREVAELVPGSALDLGCGEGGDAVWLAARGWRVTAVDVSENAVARVAGAAAEAGVAGRVEGQRHDLAESFPEGEFDLVSAHFLHTWGGMPRERILRRAAEAVAPGGVLLVVGHQGPPPWDPEAHAEVHLPTAEEVLGSLELAPGRWEVLRCGPHEREQRAPDGAVVTRTDNAVKVRRVR